MTFASLVFYVLSAITIASAILVQIIVVAGSLLFLVAQLYLFINSGGSLRLVFTYCSNRLISERTMASTSRGS